jgi:hypothetical protein
MKTESKEQAIRKLDAQKVIENAFLSVWEVTGVGKQHIMTKGKKRDDKVYPSFCVTKLLREYLPESHNKLRLIGKELNVKEHASIIHRCRVVDGEIEVSRGLKNKTPLADMYIKCRFNFLERFNLVEDMELKREYLNMKIDELQKELDEINQILS